MTFATFISGPSAAKQAINKCMDIDGDFLRLKQIYSKAIKTSFNFDVFICLFVLKSRKKWLSWYGRKDQLKELTNRLEFKSVNGLQAAILSEWYNRLTST